MQTTQRIFHFTDILVLYFFYAFLPLTVAKFIFWPTLPVNARQSIISRLDTKDKTNTHCIQDDKNKLAFSKTPFLALPTQYAQQAPRNGMVSAHLSFHQSLAVRAHCSKATAAGLLPWPGGQEILINCGLQCFDAVGWEAGRASGQ